MIQNKTQVETIYYSLKMSCLFGFFFYFTFLNCRLVIVVSARSAIYYAVKHSGQLIRACTPLRLRTGRKTKMEAFYRVKRNCLFDSRFDFG
jgi:hypothetical protein